MMANLRFLSFNFLFAVLVLILFNTQVLCYQYKVGDLNAWGVPPSSNSQVYAKWSKFHSFRIGDSLLFFYPPSQDSVIQVTEQSYNNCNITDPILYMNNGNSLFNITSPGEFYFTSGETGHCEKKQKLHISVLGNGTAYAPAYGPSSAMSDLSPSYPTVFGSIPTANSSAATQSSLVFAAAAAIGFAGFAVINGMI